MYITFAVHDTLTRVFVILHDKELVSLGGNKEQILFLILRQRALEAVGFRT